MITRLRLKNFRRYEDQVFEFGPGVTFIEGINNAGKTTIFYAIEYVLFGSVAEFKSPGGLLRPKAMVVESKWISWPGWSSLSPAANSRASTQVTHENRRTLYAETNWHRRTTEEGGQGESWERNMS